MNSSRILRRQAGDLARPFPPLLAQAERLAATMMMGEHGRRRSGIGDEFWQYRPAAADDPARLIDWRRSAKSDARFVRQKEWQALQTVMMWVDRSASMTFSSGKNLATKEDRASTLALALAILLIRAGEKVGLADSAIAPGSGQAQIHFLANELCFSSEKADYGAPKLQGLKPHIRGVFISDFMGDLQPTAAALAKAADRGVKGALLQILDPAEEAFPFDGRTIFESMSGGVRHETLKAGDLRDRYVERLSQRKSELERLARATGWLYHCHHTSESAASALMWLFSATERRRV